MTTKRKWYTVILLYPDYLTDDYGADIYVEWGLAEDPYEAVKVVQCKAVEAQRTNDADVNHHLPPAEDFKMIAVLRGQQTLELSAADWDTTAAYPQEGDPK